jgi:uncharacterized protein (TIGR03067 family)
MDNTAALEEMGGVLREAGLLSDGSDSTRLYRPVAPPVDWRLGFYRFLRWLALGLACVLLLGPAVALFANRIDNRPNLQPRLDVLELRAVKAEEDNQALRGELARVRGDIAAGKDSSAATHSELLKAMSALSLDNQKTREFLLTELGKSDKRVMEIVKTEIDAAAKRIETATRAEMEERDARIAGRLKEEADRREKQITELRKQLDLLTTRGEDSKNLPGEWRLVRVNDVVREFPEEGAPGGEIILTLDPSGGVVFSMNRGKSLMKGKFKVNDDTTPRLIDITLDGDPKPFSGLGLQGHNLCIYDLRKDALIIRVGSDKERPMGFRLGEPKFPILSFERVKPRQP